MNPVPFPLNTFMCKSFHYKTLQFLEQHSTITCIQTMMTTGSRARSVCTFQLQFTIQYQVLGSLKNMVSVLKPTQH